MSSAATLRQRLFGPPTRSRKAETPIDEAKSKHRDSSNPGTEVNGSQEAISEAIHLSAEEVGQNAWQERWDQAPEDWRDFISTKPKIFGLTGREEEKIRVKNQTYVATPPLSGNGGFGTALIIGTVAAFSKVLMKTLNSIHTYRMEMLYDFIEHRSESRGLLTFSNHQSVMDDPFLLAAVLPPRILLKPDLMRWGLCSLDICFQNSLVSRALRLGKAMPIQRRGGISQSFLRTAADKLSNGDWVHVYPEGRVRQIGMGYSKRGVGKMLAMTFEAGRGLPLVLPMYHEGIEQVMPQLPESNKLESSIPKVGKSLFVITGEPLDLAHIFHRLMPACTAAGGTAIDAAPCLRLYEEVADSMAVTLRLLRAEMRRKVRQDHGVDLGEPYELS